MSTQPEPQSPSPLPVGMPPELRDKGWKLTRSDGKFFAKNTELRLFSPACEDPEAAIVAARELDEGKTVSIDSHGNIEFKDPDVQDVPINQIRTEGGTQPREKLDLEVVDRYAEERQTAHEANKPQPFPPPTLFHDGNHYWLADGFHRFFSYIKVFASLATIPARVYPGTMRDAVLFSVGANADHGLPRSPEDKRRAVTTLLKDPEWSTWSDSLVATKSNVSQPFVSKLRRELTQNVLSDPDATPQPTERLGADGRVQETKRIGRTPAVTPAQTDILFETGVASPPAPAVAPDPEGWSSLPLLITIAVKPGKSLTRGITVSGRAGEGKPIFRTEFTYADLEPLCFPLAYLVGDLKATYLRNRSRQSAQPPSSKPKKKPATKPAKTKPTKKKPVRKTGRKK